MASQHPRRRRGVTRQSRVSVASGARSLAVPWCGGCAVDNAMRGQVHEKLEVVQSLLAELETKATRYRQTASDVPGGP